VAAHQPAWPLFDLGIVQKPCILVASLPDPLTWPLLKGCSFLVQFGSQLGIHFALRSLQSRVARRCPASSSELQESLDGRLRWLKVAASLADKPMFEIRCIPDEMDTNQATYVLAFLLRAPKRAQSWELPKAAKHRIASIQHALEAFSKLTFSSDQEALAELNHAYVLLDATPPPASHQELGARKHPIQKVMDTPNPGAETEAWKSFLAELRKASSRHA